MLNTQLQFKLTASFSVSLVRVSFLARALGRGIHAKAKSIGARSKASQRNTVAAQIRDTLVSPNTLVLTSVSGSPLRFDTSVHAPVFRYLFVACHERSKALARLRWSRRFHASGSGFLILEIIKIRCSYHTSSRQTSSCKLTRLISFPHVKLYSHLG